MFHRLSRTPTWHTASAQGPRTTNADAVAGHTSPGEEVVFALADGVGDHPSAARAAQLAVTAAVHTPAGDGPVAALLAAQRAVREDAAAGDCVLVVATAVPSGGRASSPQTPGSFSGNEGSGYRIAWVGDVRAYAWNGDSLRQLTKDHTLAQYFRDRGRPAAARMEHIVTTSVRTAGATEFGQAEIHAPVGLLLTSDGVHKWLTRAAMSELLRVPRNSAAALVDAAMGAGSTDNATAIMVDCAPPLSDLTTKDFPVPVAA